MKNKRLGTPGGKSALSMELKRIYSDLKYISHLPQAFGGLPNPT
jgi:hypothetical protein